MDYTDIAPEQAKELIQDAQTEILEHYDDFVDKVVKSSIEEGKEIIEKEERSKVDEILDFVDE